MEITRIDVYSAWRDGRAGQNLEISLSTDGVNFVSLIDYDERSAGDEVVLSSITDAAGVPLGSGVIAIRFAPAVGEMNGDGAVFREIDVIGTAGPAEDFFISTQAQFDALRQANLGPGTNVFFERGKVFNGMFAPNAVGAPGDPVTISAFGTGDKPVIQNNGVSYPHPTRASRTISAGVFLFNAEYVHVNNLEITNNNGGNQEEDLFGIYVLAEDTGRYHNEIYIEDNYVHDVNGQVAGKGRGGIHVHGYSPTSRNTATYNDLRIVNNVVNQIGGVGIATDVDDLVNAHDFPGDSRENAITNLYVAHNWVGNTGRNSYILRDCDYGLCEYNTSANSSRYDRGHSFFNFRTIGMVFQYNEAYGNTGPSGESDRGGFDADYNSKGTIIQYNYSHSNNWFCGIMKRRNADVTVRYNLSVNEEQGAYFYGFENENDLVDLKIYNNTHYYDRSESPDILVLNRTPRETTFNNEIFCAVGSGSMGGRANSGPNNTYNTNVYFNITPPNSESNAFLEDPSFVSPGAEPYNVDMQFGRDVLAGYMLAANSPYINSGVAISNNGGLDFWGNPVANGATDIGAGEFSAGAVVSPGATVLTGNLFAEQSEVTSVSVVGATPTTSALLGDDAVTSMSQSFQVDSDFDLRTIFLDYEYDTSSPGDILINVEIFEVANVGASSVVLGGSSFLTITGLSMPVLGAGEDAAIVLDSAVTLPANTGAEGYVLRITGGGNPGFEWRRTGGSGSVYAFGQAYEDGVEKNDGERDWILALSETDIDITEIGGPLLGDFDSDGDVDCDDLDGCVGNLGMAATGALAPLDLDVDGFLSLTDANSVITTLVMTSNGNVGTFPGDLNCDGTVNVLGDAFILVGSLGSAVSSYSEGDINFDGTVNVLGDAFILVGSLGLSNNP